MKIIFVFFCIGLIVDENYAKDDENFAKLGRFIQPSKGRAMHKNKFDYFLSTNEAGWNAAADDCARAFPPYGHLLALETKEEVKFLEKQVDKFGGGYVYFTSGEYDRSSKTFLWFDGTPIKKWAPWAPKFPPKQKQLNPHLRITFVHSPKRNSSWEVAAMSQPHRYICESPAMDEKPETTTQQVTVTEQEVTEPEVTVTSIKPRDSTDELTTLPSTEEPSTTKEPCRVSLGVPKTKNLKFLLKLDTRDIYYSTSKVTWLEANAACNAFNLELAELYTESEFISLRKILIPMLDEDLSGFWMGTNVIKRQNEPGVGGKFDYFWKCGEEYIPTFLWLSGEPNRLHIQGVYESCVNFFKQFGANTYGLNDYVCDWKIKFLCQTEIK